MLLSELREKYQVNDAVFLIGGAPWLQTTCNRHELRSQHVIHGNRMLSNMPLVIQTSKRTNFQSHVIMLE